MFIKTRYIVIAAIVMVVAVVVVVVAGWSFVGLMAETRAIHGYHGLCNGGVGQPYADFVHRLRTLSESGDTNTLAHVLRRADEHSRDIYDVWLDADPDAYRKSIQEILK
jgi:hypothetical protein